MEEGKRKSWLLPTLVFILTMAIAYTFILLTNVERIQEAQKITRQNNIMVLNQVFKTNDDCYSPCFYGLIPGVTKLSDIQNFTNVVTKLGYTLLYEESIKNGVLFAWKNNETNLIFFTTFIDDELGSIEIGGVDFADAKLVVDTLGPPSQYSADLITGIESVVLVIFYYEEKGGILTFPGIDPDQISENCLLKSPSELSLERIYFVEPKGGSDMLDQVFGESFFGNLVIRDWKGLDGLTVSGCRN